MSQLTICLIIFALTIISFMAGKISMACTAFASMMLYMLFGCVSAKEVLGYISNNNAVLVVGMFVVAAGFNRTRFVKKLAAGIAHLANGSEFKVLVGYVFICVLLNQFITSPLTVLSIVMPLLMSTCNEMGVSPSRLVFPVGISGYLTCAALPIGNGATAFAEYNGYLEAAGYTTYSFAITDPFKAKWPILIMVFVYFLFFAPKFAPKNPIVPIEASVTGKGSEAKPDLDPVREVLGYVIFFGTTLGLMFSTQLNLAVWQVAVIGATLVAATGVLKPREVVQAMPISLYLLIVGSLATAGALSNSGAGSLIGNALGSMISSVNNRYIAGLIFFLVPFVLTQFMNNRAVMQIFYPIAIVTAQSLGADPRGLILLITQAGLTALMTPAAAAVIPVVMSYGGYDIKSIIKQSILPAILVTIIAVGWFMTVFPV